MGQFDHLKQLDARGTKPYVFAEILGKDGMAPELQCVCADLASNDGLFNDALRADDSKVLAGEVKSAADRDRRQRYIQERAAPLYARHAVRGWSGVINGSGQEVPFSPEACEEFLLALPFWSFSKFRNWLTEPSNFVDYQIDVEAVSGN